MANLCKNTKRHLTRTLINQNGVKTKGQGRTWAMDRMDFQSIATLTRVNGTGYAQHYCDNRWNS
jgi:hypothetical protein